MKFKKFIWPLIGVIACILSIRVLYSEFTNPKSKLSQLSFHELFERFAALDWHHWLMAILFAILAYTALAGYDRIALQHLHKKVSWLFIALCSFTTYALSHNIGASVFSGAAVRYRAYSLKGLTGSDVAVLVGFCSLTFAMGVVLLSGSVLILKPQILMPLLPFLSNISDSQISADHILLAARIIGSVFLLLIALYIFGSWLQLKPLKIGRNFKIAYPRLRIVVKQLIIGPLELIGAAGIIYAVLPDASNPGFLIVLGAFLASFSIGLLSNAPGGGIGVLEIIFISLIPEIDPRDLLVALIIFRLFYLIIPLIISLFIVALFEVDQYRHRVKYQSEMNNAEP